jgi:hypothetical protein
MYGTHTLAFQRTFVRMKIISLIFMRFSYVSLIRNSVTGPRLGSSPSLLDPILDRALRNTLNTVLFSNHGQMVYSHLVVARPFTKRLSAPVREAEL